MNKIRNEIDKIDEKIFKLLKSRFGKAKKIGQLKKYLKVTTDDEKGNKKYFQNWTM